ncbi:carbohydrate esterase family 16 protein [Boletus coccyginus]|nr:carbohydrate esterase family 16 protein [Boletus coccyginus]
MISPRSVASALLAFVMPCLALGVAPGQIQNFVTFGDSYTDASYYPSASGGYQWPTWAAGYGPFDLYGFAKSGATCSNLLTYRPDPPIMEWQIPTYLNETYNGTLALDAQGTMYTIWIGTNDLGVNALLTGSDAPDVSIVPVRQCVIDALKWLYESGARNFIMQNIIPLDLTILYAKDSYINRYWTAERNTTEWNVYMRELVRAGNRITQLELQALAPSLPEAHIALFDSYELFTDIYNHPSNYLNGTAPLNVTGCVDASDIVNCTVAEGSAQDSFMWYDELHPSQQSARVLAREMANVMSGQFSAWATWLS